MRPCKYLVFCNCTDRQEELERKKVVDHGKQFKLGTPGAIAFKPEWPELYRNDAPVRHGGSSLLGATYQWRNQTRAVTERR